MKNDMKISNVARQLPTVAPEEKSLQHKLFATTRNSAFAKRGPRLPQPAHETMVRP